MLFNSYFFIAVFLPVTFLVYTLLNRHKLTKASRIWLVLASLFFYSYWDYRYLILILLTIIVNFLIGTRISATFADESNSMVFRRKLFFVAGITWNLLLLMFFKYTDFFLVNINQIFSSSYNLLHIVLPLGISFFTFTQIAYIVDCFKGEVKETGIINYSLFVTFFPHLLAGPILHHKEMMPQFDSARAKVLNHKNIAVGIFLFSIGLFKKVLIADSFAIWANEGFDNAVYLTFFEAWAASLSYSLQLYFDFSGYTDMALGISMLFNIRLPINFNSPYKAVNIQDFWRRWHITLSRFLRDYIYIPLGGNKKDEGRIYFNLMCVFLIGGFWHGAGWTFLFWGFLHGCATVVHRIWQRLGFKMNRHIAILLTFNFINITWVFFRAKDWDSALKVLKGMTGASGFILPKALEAKLAFIDPYFRISFDEWLVNIRGDQKTFFWILAFLAVSFTIKNSNQIVERFTPNWKYACFTAAILTAAILSLTKVTEFIYFNF